MLNWMATFSQRRDPPKQLKADTRQWTSGRVKFAVLGWEHRPEENYIIFEKNFLGQARTPDQKFNLRQRDWINLKKLIDGELQPITKWDAVIPAVDQGALSTLIAEHPDLFEKLLSNPNILKLSESSFESLDRLAVKLYEIKADRVDLILKELSKATGQDINLFGSLLEDLRLNQVSMMASLVYQKLKVLDLLERTCTNTNNLEKDVHDIFDANPWLVGKAYDIVQSDRPLSQYLQTKLQPDSESRKRPDLIVKTIPSTQNVLLIELKAPGIKLKAKHIGQVLEYKALIKNNKPNAPDIDCFVFGYEKDSSFLLSKDAELKTFSELISELRTEYREYSKIIESSKEAELPSD
jgi:hypothetical protein